MATYLQNVSNNKEFSDIVGETCAKIGWHSDEIEKDDLVTTTYGNKRNKWCHISNSCDNMLLLPAVTVSNVG